MPDIDMDFDERRRDEVIRYATERYGSDHVAQIVTFQTIKGKQGIRDAARVLGFPPVVGDRLCKMYPPAVMGRDYPIEDALEISPGAPGGLREGARGEGDRRHGAGARGPAPRGLGARGRRRDRRRAARELPAARSSRRTPATTRRRVVTQFDMNGVEALGLLKMDFLGLRTLSVIEDTCAICAPAAIELDIDHVPLDDAATYAMLQRGETRPASSRWSPRAMRSLIKLLAPDRFEDLMALRRALPAGAAEPAGCTPSTPSASTAGARSRTRTRTWRRSCPRRTA